MEDDKVECPECGHQFPVEGHQVGAHEIGDTGKDGKNAAQRRKFTERFRTVPQLRRAFGCHTEDEDAPEYRASLKRYLKSVNADPNFLPPVNLKK